MGREPRREATLPKSRALKTKTDIHAALIGQLSRERA
jgi:hypothetical protein